MTFAALEDVLDNLALYLENEADSSKGKKTKETLKEAAEAVRNILPDPEAMKPEPDPIAVAQAFLLEERIRAQKVLVTEAARMKKEAVIKEAFFMPCGVLNGIMDIALSTTDDNRHENDRWRDVRDKIEAFLEAAGWTVDSGFGSYNPAYTRSREPLRLLARLMEDFPRHTLTTHVLAVLHYALRWCENTSYAFISPMTGKAQPGVPPEGVLYPHISMEFVKVESSKDVPKEWTKPLVTEPGKE
jgi:hypothetical protein